jgi:hypothetical protein
MFDPGIEAALARHYRPMDEAPRQARDEASLGWLWKLIDEVEKILDELEEHNQGFDYEEAYQAGTQFKYRLEEALERSSHLVN